MMNKSKPIKRAQYLRILTVQRVIYKNTKHHHGNTNYTKLITKIYKK